MSKKFIQPVAWWIHDKCYDQVLEWMKSDDLDKITVNIDLGLTEPYPIYDLVQYDEWRAKVRSLVEAKNK